MAKSKKKTYHHGELREALLNEANRQLLETGVSGISIRKIADALNVSHAAPYHHFSDKDALLSALAERGFEKQQLLLAELEEKTLASKSNLENSQRHLIDFVEGYVTMALANPAVYKVMYSQKLWAMGAASEALRDIAIVSYKQWQYLVEAFVEQGVFHTESISLPAQPSKRIAQSVWSSLHGICHFGIDGIYINEADVREMAVTSIELTLSKHSIMPSN